MAPTGSNKILAPVRIEPDFIQRCQGRINRLPRRSDEGEAFVGGFRGGWHDAMPLQFC